MANPVQRHPAKRGSSTDHVGARGRPGGGSGVMRKTSIRTRCPDVNAFSLRALPPSSFQQLAGRDFAEDSDALVDLVVLDKGVG